MFFIIVILFNIYIYLGEVWDANNHWILPKPQDLFYTFFLSSFPLNGTWEGDHNELIIIVLLIRVSVIISSSAFGPDDFHIC